jgi:hypothetical protein
MIRRTAPFAFPFLAACTPSPEHPERAAAAPHFAVTAFFGGASHGEGMLKVTLRKPVAIHVRSFGRVDRGTLILDQKIVEGAKPPRTRQWRIREVAPGRYAGTLSDAAGPVTGDVSGNRLTLRFAMRGRLQATQWLTLQPGGRVALNGMAIRKWGVRIASLEERIAKD